MRSTRALLRLAPLLVLLCSTEVSLAKRGDAAPAEAPTVAPGAAGNLAVIDLKTYEITTSGAERRILVRSLIENQTPIDLHGAFTLDLRKLGKGRTTQALGSCSGDGVPQGRVAVCEIWVPGEQLKEQDLLEVGLRRSGALGAWDNDPSDDVRSIALRTTPERGNLLRIAQWRLFPTILSGAGDVQFEFTVEGAHLVWVLTPELTNPRLLAGHPADGVLTGKGRERIRISGPVTLVARNSLGAFVYHTVPVVHPYAPVKKTWTETTPGDAPQAGAIAQVLDAGVYDVPEDQVVLNYLTAYLAAKDWGAEISRLRQQAEGEPDPLPASALNPKAK